MTNLNVDPFGAFFPICSMMLPASMAQGSSSCPTRSGTLSINTGKLGTVRMEIKVPE